MEDNNYGFNENENANLNENVNETSKNEVSTNEVESNESEIKTEPTDFIIVDKIDTEPKVENLQSSEFKNNYTVEDKSVETPKTQVYYTESYKKPKEKKHKGVFQLILVSVFSAIFGAAVFFAATQLVTPIINSNSTVLTGKDNSSGATQKIVQINSTSDSAVTAIAEKVSPSIVGIKVTVASSGQDFFFDIGGEGVGEGSGIIISEDGYILTNNHVIENALDANTKKISQGSKIEVILPSQKDKSYAATVVGRDTKSDIAVLKIEATGLPKAELGDSSALKVGELAVAIGNPGGMDYMGSVTAGIISGLDRTIQLESGATLNLIQTDAAINPGNSGGALCNSKGQVIGINTVKISATGFEGLGFAIPINHAKEISQSLIDYKYVKGRPYLGVQVDNRFTADIAKANNVPAGVLVYDVTPLSAAYKAGIQKDDIITKFDGVKVTQYSDLENQKNKHKPGDVVEVEVYRYNDKTTKTLKVTLDEDKN
jgi:Trypsin-like serine proteases, typically periplasmic, contain C-terminal PDZ domain